MWDIDREAHRLPDIIARARADIPAIARERTRRRLENPQKQLNEFLDRTDKREIRLIKPKLRRLRDYRNEVLAHAANPPRREDPTAIRDIFFVTTVSSHIVRGLHNMVDGDDHSLRDVRMLRRRHAEAFWAQVQQRSRSWLD